VCHGSRKKYDAAGVRPVLVLIATAFAALLIPACGSEGISVPEDDPTHEGAVLFAQRCSGCHTISAAGTQGSGSSSVRPQGPDFNQRSETFEDALFAIQNGGFSGAIMPQNIAVGEDAIAIARFVEKWSGNDVEEPNLPTPEEDANLAAEESGDQTTSTDSSSGSSGE
jgi:mono/diheme cytochrome c family protein